MLRYIIGMIVGSLLTGYIVADYAMKNEQLLLIETRMVAHKAYFTGCVDSLVGVGLPAPKEFIVQACGAASAEFTTPIDELLKDQ